MSLFCYSASNRSITINGLTAEELATGPFIGEDSLKWAYISLDAQTTQTVAPNFIENRITITGIKLEKIE